MLSKSVVVAAAFVLVAAGGAREPPAPTVTNVVNPVVNGPIPASVPPGDPSHDYPFFSTDADLARYGYVEEEYFFSGWADKYVFGSAMEDAVAAGTAQWYQTRMIVRRPTKRQSFNGTVVMEWLNTAVGYDLDGLWLTSHSHLMRRGYAWIGVSAFRASVHTPVTGLEAWSPARYGLLDVPAAGADVNALSFDIFSQAAQAVKAPAGIDPMGGLHVERIVATGASLSANSGIVPYHNGIHRLAGVFDGFFVAIGGTMAAIRTDLDVKVFKLWTETEAARSSAIGRQPDSDRLRRWEIAGAAHFGWDLVAAVSPLRLRDVGSAPLFECDLPPYSRVPFFPVANAALDHMVAWVKHGIAPPTAPRIEVATVGDPNSVVRDEFGNALGGIRLPAHAVPTATNTGLNGPASNFCRTFGSHVPFDEATLDALYPQHGRYVSRVAQVARENVRDGFIVKEDATTFVQTASRLFIGKP
jgi:hypothetical protein